MLKDGPSSRLLFGKRIEGPVQKLVHIMKAAALDSFAQATFEFRRMDFDAHLKVSLALIIAPDGRAYGCAENRALFELRQVRFSGRDSDRKRRTRPLSRPDPGAAGKREDHYAGMPEGPFQADAPRVVLPDREKMKTQMEALIYHFKIVTEGFRVPAGEVYQCIESPRGEIGYYIVSDGTSKPYRVHMRTPSFGNVQGLSKMLEGILLADSIAALGSMDFVLGDTDR
jgi:Respiratory-chain NADH dehydrogenase, 49 Kd subunit